MAQVSVIIPVYNSEQFLKLCLRSVAGQTYKALEILLVDDGSSDKSLEICRQLQETDPRIRLIRQEHSGVSAARNRGLKAAEGKYVFFLDSDDAIHPCLIEELVRQAEDLHLDMTFCNYKKTESSQMDEVWRELAEQAAEVQSGERQSSPKYEAEYHLADRGESSAAQRDVELNWMTADKAASEGWFHIKFFRQLTGIGGKLVRKSTADGLRFDENFTNGEDTLFLYHLISRGISIGYTDVVWYLYRIHPESLVHSSEAGKGAQSFQIYRMVRDMEYEKQHMEFALAWERELSRIMLYKFTLMKKQGNEEGYRFIKKQAAAELKHPLFRKLDLLSKSCFLGCIFCSPLYDFLRKLFFFTGKEKNVEPAGQETQDKAETQRESTSQSREELTSDPVVQNVESPETSDMGEPGSSGTGSVGILTFHCADNYGAMLQTYGLKQYLRSQGVDIHVVPYEPPYMTGRHWWIPYLPAQGWKGRIWCLYNLLGGWYANLPMKKDFFRRRANMKHFRTKHLLDLGETPYKKLRFTFQLQNLPYSHYIVGSDQIWNPDITFGLRKAYFGAFENKNKEKVIAYAASLGGSCLSPKYDGEFSEMLSHVDVISLREAEAVPYVKQFCDKPIETVLDPVFLLDQHAWQQIEKPPEREGYILVYTTEKNQDLVDYVRALSEEKGLPIVELRAGAGITDETFEVDRTAGPAEFLGYIHKADYVVTNSFHAAAFSIIYEKPFFVFLHSNRGARLTNVLRVHGLENRIYRKDRYTDIDAPVDWGKVEEQSRENARLSKEFLRKHTVAVKI